MNKSNLVIELLVRACFVNTECYMRGDITTFTVCEYSNRIHWKALHMYHMLEYCHCARCSLGASHDSS